MIITLPATSTDEIVSRLVSLEGMTGGSRVLTLIIPTDDADLAAALAAAHGASRDHPCRVVAVVLPETRSGDDRLDAEIRVGHDTGAGETLVLRPSGLAAEHIDTVVVPFLLPDVPVVTWWPRQMPSCPARDPLGQLAGTRITNSPAHDNPTAALAAVAPSYTRGDIDLAWTRITLWRALVASTLQPALDTAWKGANKAEGAQTAEQAGDAEGVKSIEMVGERANASLALMAAWLRLHLHAPVTTQELENFSGIARISVHTAEGCYLFERSDQERVRVLTPASIEAQIVTMPRREPVTTLNEELRRLAPDVVFEEVLSVFASEHGCQLPCLDVKETEGDLG